MNALNIFINIELREHYEPIVIFLLLLLPIVYGPHFAENATNFNYGLQFAVPVLFSVILVALDNIQSHLENPFDQQGEDDVDINVDKFIKNLG